MDLSMLLEVVATVVVVLVAVVFACTIARTEKIAMVSCCQQGSERHG